MLFSQRHINIDEISYKKSPVKLTGNNSHKICQTQKCSYMFINLSVHIICKRFYFSVYKDMKCWEKRSKTEIYKYVNIYIYLKHNLVIFLFIVRKHFVKFIFPLSYLLHASHQVGCVYGWPMARRSHWSCAPSSMIYLSPPSFHFLLCMQFKIYIKNLKLITNPEII